MKKSLTLLTLSLTSLLPLNNANAYQDLNVTLDGVTYNLISHTNNWWLPGGETEVGDLATPGYDPSSLTESPEIRGGSLPEGFTAGTPGTSLNIYPSSMSTPSGNAFIATIYATNGDRYQLRYNRSSDATGTLDGLNLVQARKRVGGVWSNISTNGSTLIFPSTLNFRDHIADANVKNFFEYALGVEFQPANLFSSAPTYYTPPAPPSPIASGGVTEQAQQLNTGLSFQNGQWVPEE